MPGNVKDQQFASIQQRRKAMAVTTIDHQQIWDLHDSAASAPWGTDGGRPAGVLIPAPLVGCGESFLKTNPSIEGHTTPCSKNQAGQYGGAPPSREQDTPIFTVHQRGCWQVQPSLPCSFTRCTAQPASGTVRCATRHQCCLRTGRSCPVHTAGPGPPHRRWHPRSRWQCLHPG